MSEWPKVRWTQARQIAELMELPRTELPDAQLTPQRWVEDKATAGDLAGAVMIMGHALPRYEVVAWAAEAIGRKPDGSPVAGAVARWLDGSDEATRRELWALAEQVDEAAPARLLAYSVFFSGGSIAPEDQAPVNPSPALCGRFAAAAIVKHAFAGDDPDAALGAALERGRSIAQGQAE